MANPFRMLIEWLSEMTQESVSPSEAITLPSLYYGVNKICNHCANLPLVIHKKLRKGGSEKAMDHWAYSLLDIKPNSYQTSDVLRNQITAHAILWGNGRLAIVNRGRSDAELIPLMPDRTTTVMVEGRKYHVTKPNKHDRLPLFEDFAENMQEYVVLSDDDVIHIQGFGFDGVNGISLVQAMRRSLGLGIAQEERALSQTKKGFNASLLLEVAPGDLRDEKEAKRFIDAFNEAHTDPDNAGKAGLLRNGMKATVLNMSNSDAQFIESRQISRQDIMLMLGLDSLPGDGDSHSYNSKVMESLNYLDTGLSPWTSRWEKQVDAKILTQQERRRGYYSRYNFAALLRVDPSAQADIIIKYIGARVLNPNEGREYLDMNPYEGGDTYENPNTSTGPAGSVEPANAPNATLIAQAWLKKLIGTEASNAVNGAKNKDFIGWIDRNYAKWEAKLADSFEEAGLDRDLARVHCEESKEMLLEVAGRSTPDNIEQNVRELVSTWQNRTFKLLEAQYV